MGCCENTMTFKMTLNFPRDWTRISPAQDHRQTAHVILIWSSGCQFQRSDQWPAPFTQALIRRVMLCLFWATSMLSTPAQFGQWSVHTPIQSPQALPMSLIYQLTTLDNLYSDKAFDELMGKLMWSSEATWFCWQKETFPRMLLQCLK